MKSLIASLAVVGLAVSAQATPYARWIDFHHVHQSASDAISISGARSNVVLTDVGILTHSTADGSIMPAFCRNSWCPPEDWSILEVGAGGSAHMNGLKVAGNAVLDVGTSWNLAPQLGGVILQKVDAGSPAWLQSVKASMLNKNGNGVRLGVGLNVNAIQDGTFQSAKEMFNARGFVANVRQDAVAKVGFAWTY